MGDELAAGRFGAWLGGVQRALAGDGELVVPCGACTACCTSSQFVHVGPDERDALAHIPPALLFPAPRMPRGHVLMGYDERGHCPMLVDGACSIYEHRPRTCRTYDCRVFAAAGIEAEDVQVEIGRQARRWRFDDADADDAVLQEAVRAAARYVEEHRSELPPAAVPATATQRAVLAMRIHEAFLSGDAATGRTARTEPDLELLRALLP